MKNIKTAKDRFFSPLDPSGYRKTKIAIGTWRMGGQHFGSYDQREGEGLIRKAIDLGYRCFDTAHFYAHGQSDQLLGKCTSYFITQIFIIDFNINNFCPICHFK